MGKIIKLEQFIYTNINDRGRSIRHSTIDSASLRNNFANIMGLFTDIPTSLNIVFSKFNDDYYIYYECKEEGFERIGIEKKKGRRADISVGLLIPLEVMDKLYYDFSLVYLLLSKKIDWENIVNKLDDDNFTLKPLTLDLNTTELMKKLKEYLKNNSSIDTFIFSKNNLKKNTKIISNSNITTLIHYASSLPQDIGKNTVFSTLKIHSSTNNDTRTIKKEIANNLYYEQIFLLENFNIEKYQEIKKYDTIIPIPTLLEPTLIINKKSNNDMSRDKKVSIKALAYLSITIIFLILIIPFYKYHQLYNVPTKNITQEVLDKYKNLIENDGFFLNSLTDIGKEYKRVEEKFIIRKIEEIMNSENCNVNNETLLFTKTVVANRGKLKKKYTCMLRIKIEKVNEILKDKKVYTLDLINEQISTIDEYFQTAEEKKGQYDKDLIKYHKFYEEKYFEPIIKAFKFKPKKKLLKLIEVYERNTKLNLYKNEIEQIKSLLEKKEINIELKIKSEKNRKINIEYLNTNGEKVFKEIGTSSSHSLRVLYTDKGFLNIKKGFLLLDKKIFEGRLLKPISGKIDIRLWNKELFKDLWNEKLFKVSKMTFIISIQGFEGLNFSSLSNERIKVHIEKDRNNED